MKTTNRTRGGEISSRYGRILARPGSALAALGVFYAMTLTTAARTTAQPLPMASVAGAATSPKINVDRHAITLAPGSAASVHVYGAGQVLAQPSWAGIDAAYDPTTHTLTISAKALGSGKVAVSQPGGDTDAIVVHVVPPAATVPATR
jgi:hypothetical protein